MVSTIHADELAGGGASAAAEKACAALAEDSLRDESKLTDATKQSYLALCPVFQGVQLKALKNGAEPIADSIAASEMPLPPTPYEAPEQAAMAPTPQEPIRLGAFAETETKASLAQGRMAEIAERNNPAVQNWREGMPSPYANQAADAMAAIEPAAGPAAPVPQDTTLAQGRALEIAERNLAEAAPMAASPEGQLATARQFEIAAQNAELQAKEPVSEPAKEEATPRLVGAPLPTPEIAQAAARCTLSRVQCNTGAHLRDAQEALRADGFNLHPKSLQAAAFKAAAETDMGANNRPSITKSGRIDTGLSQSSPANIAALNRKYGTDFNRIGSANSLADQAKIAVLQAHDTLTRADANMARRGLSYEKLGISDIQYAYSLHTTGSISPEGAARVWDNPTRGRQDYVFNVNNKFNTGFMDSAMQATLGNQVAYDIRPSSIARSQSIGAYQAQNNYGMAYQALASTGFDSGSLSLGNTANTGYGFAMYDPATLAPQSSLVASVQPEVKPTTVPTQVAFHTTIAHTDLAPESIGRPNSLERGFELTNDTVMQMPIRSAVNLKPDSGNTLPGYEQVRL
jgi:hypothetical protein